MPDAVAASRDIVTASSAAANRVVHTADMVRKDWAEGSPAAMSELYLTVLVGLIEKGVRANRAEFLSQEFVSAVGEYDKAWQGVIEAVSVTRKSEHKLSAILDEMAKESSAARYF